MPISTDLCSKPMLALLLLMVNGELQADDNVCPPPPASPGATQSAIPPNSRTLDPYSVTQTVRNYYEAALGLGFLEVTGEIDQHYYDWMFELELPVWSAPDSTRPLGWLSGGRVYARSNVGALTGAGMIETDYEQTSFIVWDTRAEWLKLRLTNDLYAWTHQCHLQSAMFGLEFVRWEEFLRRHADWLHFRKPVPHNLRQNPDSDGEHIATIGLDHKLILLDIRGDWMEVEVEQPDLTCGGPDGDESQSVRQRGWVKWRDERGPWVYIYTRGC